MSHDEIDLNTVQPPLTRVTPADQVKPPPKTFKSNRALRRRLGRIQQPTLTKVLTTMFNDRRAAEWVMLVDSTGSETFLAKDTKAKNQSKRNRKNQQDDRPLRRYLAGQRKSLNLKLDLN